MRFFRNFVLIVSVVFLVFADLASGLDGLDTLTSGTDADELTTATRQLRAAYHDRKLSEERAFFSMESIGLLWVRIAKWFRDLFGSTPSLKQRAVMSEGAEHDASALDMDAIGGDTVREYEAMAAKSDLKTMDLTDGMYKNFLINFKSVYANQEDMAELGTLVKKHGGDTNAALFILEQRKDLLKTLFKSWVLKKELAAGMADRIVSKLGPEATTYQREHAYQLGVRYTVFLKILEKVYLRYYQV